MKQLENIPDHYDYTVRDYVCLEFEKHEIPGNWYPGIEMYDWLMETTEGDWAYYASEIRFELEADALAFKLRWENVETYNDRAR